MQIVIEKFLLRLVEEQEGVRSSLWSPTLSIALGPCGPVVAALYALPLDYKQSI